MKKLNKVLARILLIFLVLHGIIGNTNLLEISKISIKFITVLLEIIFFSHAILGIIEIMKSIIVGVRSKTWYIRRNIGLWIKYITGIGTLMLIFLHVSIYIKLSNGDAFTSIKVILQIIFILFITVHIIFNVKPMLISTGILNYEKRLKLYLIILFIMTLLLITGTVLYHIKSKV